jgi:hypothetical protein
LLKSITLWFNTTGLLVLGIAMSDPLLTKWMMDEGFMAFVIIANILLRFKTERSKKWRESSVSED